MAREINRKSRPQTFLSMAIIAILIVIGVSIFIKQYQYNPGVLPKDLLLPGPNQDKPSAPSLANASFVPLPEGLQPLTAMETFDARNLSDKINGKAELYLSAGFNRLVSQRFQDEGATGRWMETFVYDMGNSQNAFSVFSAQRRKDGEPIGLAPYAYRTSNAIFLVHGRYYVEIIASQESDQVPVPVKMMAETFIRNTLAEASTVNEAALFPKQELVKDSIALIASDAFGYEAFDKIYTAEYIFGDHSVTAFLSHRRTSEEAKALASSYSKFLLAYGGQNIAAQLPIADARWIAILDTYEIVFSHGPYLAGIREAITIDEAKTLAVRLFRRIKEGEHESPLEP